MTVTEEELVVVRHVVDVRVPLRTRLISGGAIIAAGLICIFAWGFGANPGDADFGLRTVSDAIPLPDITIPATPTSVVLGLIAVALGAWHAVRGFSRPQMRWVIAAVLLCFVVAFLCWASTGTPGNPLNVPGLLQNTILLATPLVLGALAGILCERTGVINVAIEGQFLAGAFAGALGASVSHSLGVGVVSALVAGGLMGALLAVFAIRFLVNQVVLGVVLNAFALGITGFGFDALMAQDASTYNEPGFFSPIAIPLLSDIPVIGPVFFNVNIIVYLTYVLIIVIDVALFRTRWGLRTRAVGEHPRAADTVGIRVLRIAVPQRDPGRGGGRARGRVPHDRRDRRVHEGHLVRQGVHRARGGDLREVEPAWRDRRGPALRVRRRPAEPPVSGGHTGADPVQLPAHAALPGHALRRGRAGGEGVGPGRRWAAVHEVLTPSRAT